MSVEGNTCVLISRMISVVHILVIHNAMLMISGFGFVLY